MDKNTTVVFPAPLMSAIGDLANSLAREAAAAVNTTTDHQSDDAAANGNAVGNGQCTS